MHVQGELIIDILYIKDTHSWLGGLSYPLTHFLGRLSYMLTHFLSEAGHPTC